MKGLGSQTDDGKCVESTPVSTHQDEIVRSSAIRVEGTLDNQTSMEDFIMCYNLLAWGAEAISCTTTTDLAETGMVSVVVVETVAEIRDRKRDTGRKELENRDDRTKEKKSSE